MKHKTFLVLTNTNQHKIEYLNQNKFTYSQSSLYACSVLQLDYTDCFTLHLNQASQDQDCPLSASSMQHYLKRR